MPRVFGTTNIVIPETDVLAGNPHSNAHFPEYVLSPHQSICESTPFTASESLNTRSSVIGHIPPLAKEAASTA